MKRLFIVSLAFLLSINLSFSASKKEKRLARIEKKQIRKESHLTAKIERKQAKLVKLTQLIEKLRKKKLKGKSVRRLKRKEEKLAKIKAWLSQFVQPTCPEGFVQIPANPSIGTDNDFCVMKYEASNDGENLPISLATNQPWTNVTPSEAKSACQSLGEGYDLISNEEWMTIAINIENVDANWSEGIVGEGCLKQGNNGLNTTCGYDSPMDPDYGEARNSKAMHTLNNGETVYDMAGNAREWVDYIEGTNQCVNGFYNLVDINCLDINTYMPEGIYSGDQGVGKAYLHNLGRTTARGGMWSSRTIAGVFALDFSSPAHFRNSASGFRCVYRD